MLLGVRNLGIVLLAMGLCRAQDRTATENSVPTFGVTVVVPYGFCGRIFEVPEPQAAPLLPQAPTADQRRPGMSGTTLSDWPNARPNVSCAAKLPDFRGLEPLGKIYTAQLNVPTRDFREGFPGVTDRFEWFAIDFTARFWISTPGKYEFLLLSDDGSKLYIDERVIVDNDCMHQPLSVGGSARLQGGLHDMRVSYFQGPRYQVALVLYVKPPGEQWRVFDTEDFKPPTNPEDWKYSTFTLLDAPRDPCQAKRLPQKTLKVRKPS